MFNDSDLRNIIQTCEHSLTLVEMLARYGGSSPIQNRAAVALIQAKCEAELIKRAQVSEKAQEDAEDAAAIAADEAASALAAAKPDATKVA